MADIGQDTQENLSEEPRLRGCRLVNATRHRIWADTPAGPVLLPQIQSPTVGNVVAREDEAVTPFLVTTPAGDVEVPIRVGPARPDITIELPDEQPGVAYLVEAAVLLQLPHRTDLLTPASYRTLLDEDRPAEAREDELVGVLWAAHSSLSVAPPGLENLSLHLTTADWAEPLPFG